jgi:hypothetical protein
MAFFVGDGYLCSRDVFDAAVQYLLIASIVQT